jgi:mono/diheme cytochrome c family protein
MKRALIIIVAGLLISCASRPKEIPIENIDKSFVARGEYLAKSVAACGFCHGEQASPAYPLSGGRVVNDSLGEIRAPNLTPHDSGLEGWKINRIVGAIRNSVNSRGEGFSPVFHQGAEWMSDTDAISIAAYLQSVPPVDNEVPRREVDFIIRNTLGLLIPSGSEVPGFVPAIDSSNPVARGEYLVNHVSRCQQCHNSGGLIIGGEGFLKGGKGLKFNGKEAVAPALLGDDTTIQSWSDVEIERFLRTGVTKYSRVVDLELCPINFYKLAAEEDVSAIAAYLRSLSVTDASSGN